MIETPFAFLDKAVEVLAGDAETSSTLYAPNLSM